MANREPNVGHLAAQVRAALAAADLDAYRELLDPDVSWGPPEDNVSGCHDRNEVLAWYRRARARGVRADVTDVEVHGDRILVGLLVHGRDVAERWQVLTVKGGRISDIRGFDDRDSAERTLPRADRPI